jgi:hypothetical protein
MFCNKVVINGSYDEEKKDADTNPRQLTDKKVFRRLSHRGTVNFSQRNNRKTNSSSEQ